MLSDGGQPGPILIGWEEAHQLAGSVLSTFKDPVQAYIKNLRND